MKPITQVQQDMLGRLEQLRELSGGATIKPASTTDSGISEAFEQSLRAVDAQQHKAGAAMAAVDSGKSDDLMGAMLESQKASVSFAALLQVRNKLASAFDDIMRIPL